MSEKVSKTVRIVRIIVFFVTILPYIVFILITSMGYIWLNVWQRKLINGAFWRDSVFLYKRFLRELK